MADKNDTCYEENFKPTTELKEALEESEKILNGEIDSKGYHNIEEMFDDILNK